MELNKCLEHHNLSEQGTKEDKIERITCHYLRGNRLTINNKNIRSTFLSGGNSSTEKTATVKMKTVMMKILMKIYDEVLKVIKVHIPPLTKFRPETPCGVKRSHAKNFWNRNCGFPTIKLFSFEKSQNYDVT